MDIERVCIFSIDGVYFYSNYTQDNWEISDNVFAYTNYNPPVGACYLAAGFGDGANRWKFLRNSKPDSTGNATMIYIENAYNGQCL